MSESRSSSSARSAGRCGCTSRTASSRGCAPSSSTRPTPVVDHRGARPEVHAAAQDHPAELRGAGAAARLHEPHPVPAEAQELRPQRRAASGAARQGRVRAHLLGRGARPRGRRDHPHPRDLRSGGHHRHDLVAPQLGLPALQARAPRALLQHPRLQPVPRQSRQLGGLALGRDPRLGLLVAPGPLRAVGAPAGRAQAHRADHLLVGGPQQHLLHVQRPGEPHLAASG